MASESPGFLNSKFGTTLTVVGVLVLVGICAYLVKSNLGSPEAAAANDRVFMDSSTGKTFSYDLKVGDTLPVMAPSGNKTGYPTEKCFWTADGGTKTTPSYVLLKSYLGQNGPTFCPDCGRLVVFNNPAPGPGVRPPPTQAQYMASHGSDALR